MITLDDGARLLGLTAVTAAVGLVLTACATGPAPVMTADEVAAVTADPRSSPEQVVTAYLGALQEHDTSAVRGLLAPDRQGAADAWLDDTPEITDVRVEPAVAHDATESVAAGYRSSLYVPVQFVLRGGDGSMPDGANGWGYLLARDADGDPWRIVDQGVG